MNLKINKRLKIAIIFLILTFMIIISYLIFKELNNQKFLEKDTPLYTYNNKASINYTIFLKPNNLYEGNTLDEGNLYITEFIDHIKTNFTYEFTGESPADLRGNYEILAKVQGFTGEGEKLKNIWEKDYIIVRNKRFDIKDTTKSITEEVKLNLDSYNEFVKEIKETSKINSQTMLTLVMNINVEGMTDKGPIEETISPSLVIPLDTAMFEIGGNSTIDKPGVIEETTQVQIPADPKKLLLNGIIIGIFILALIFVLFFTKTAPNKDPFEKMLKKIFKNHGDRLVALNSDLVISNENIRYVKSIDDLVKMADEIGKPILYKYSQDDKDINKFYVVDEKQIYLLDISEMIVKYENDSISADNSMEDIEEVRTEG